MYIYSKKGDKVVFTGEGGYEYENKFARQWLKINNIYTINYTIVNSFNTDVILEEFPDKKFNSVQFDDARVADEYNSDIIDSLFEDIKEPNRDDYKGDGSTQDYIDDLLIYVERLKRNHEIEMEMLTQALEDDDKRIKEFEEWVDNQPFWKD